MKASIRNVLMTERADIEIGGITLIAGKNTQGKSSVGRAIAAGLAKKPILISNLSVKDSHKDSVKDGSAKGFIEIKNDSGTVNIFYPKGEAESIGLPPQSSVYGAGLVSWLDLDKKDKPKELMKLLKEEASFKDLESELKPQGFSDEEIKTQWETIEKEDWDVALSKAEETGKELKRDLKTLTGQQWGKDQSGKWLPAAWQDDLEKAAEPGLKEKVQSAEKELESALKEQAVDDHEYSKLQEEAMGIDLAIEAEKKATAQIESTEIKLKEALDTLATLPSPQKPQETTPCMACGAAQVIVGKTLANPMKSDISPEAAEQMLANIKEQEYLVEQLKVFRNLQRNDLQEATANRLSASKAFERMEKLDKFATKKDAAIVAKNVDEKRNALTSAKSRLTAFQQKTKARQLYADVMHNQILIDTLAPSGLRQQKLVTAIAKFNSQTLAPMCDTASWKRLEIQPDLSITYGGKLPHRFSESEKFRVRVLIQAAIAQLDKSDVLVIDAAELLDAEQREAILAMLESIGKPTVLIMTYDSQEETPNLAEYELGRSYWVENGITEQIMALQLETAK